jgi:hypothetical protein
VQSPGGVSGGEERLGREGAGALGEEVIGNRLCCLSVEGQGTSLALSFGDPAGHCDARQRGPISPDVSDFQASGLLDTQTGSQAKEELGFVTATVGAGKGGQHGGDF